MEEEYPEVLPEEDKQERRSRGSQSLYFVFPGNDFTKYCRVHSSFPGPEIVGMDLSPVQQNWDKEVSA